MMTTTKQKAKLELLTEAEREDLRRYAAQNGRRWRDRLCGEWMAGHSVLRETRNRIGPSGLWDIKF